MPTVYERYQRYLSQPNAVEFAKGRYKRLHHYIKKAFDLEPEMPPLKYVEIVEGAETFTVRDYPQVFVQKIDRIIWKFCRYIGQQPSAREPEKKIKKVIKKPAYRATAKNG
jgi:hypothetical protein